jgi:hypothetical protein
MTAKTIVITSFVIAVFLYQIVSRTHAAGAVPPNRVVVTKSVEYSIAPVGGSADALRAVLDLKGNEGWELAAPGRRRSFSNGRKNRCARFEIA